MTRKGSNHNEKQRKNKTHTCHSLTSHNHKIKDYRSFYHSTIYEQTLIEKKKDAEDLDWQMRQKCAQNKQTHKTLKRKPKLLAKKKTKIIELKKVDAAALHQLNH